MYRRDRRFRPTLFSTVLTLVFLPVFIALGRWQLHRADEKRALIAQYELGARTTQRFSALSADRLPQLQTVVASGKFDPDHQILLDSMPSALHKAPGGGVVGGDPGYEVLTPFRLDDGYIVLVNRGWIPLGQSRQQLPDLTVTAQHRDIRGRVGAIPQPGIRLSGGNDGTSWPRILNFPSQKLLRKLYGERLLTPVILLDPAQPDGFAREWDTHYSFGDFGPERHVGYAVQWFAFGVTLVVIYILVGFRRKQPTETVTDTATDTEDSAS